MGIAVVMPCFNEAATLGGVLDQMPRTLEGHRVTVVVVDDGSNDATPDIARSFGTELIRQPLNLGKGAALRRALDELRSIRVDASVWMDGDGQHLPSSLLDVVRPVLSEATDLCVGSRYLGSVAFGSAPLNRRLVRAGSIWAVERVTGHRLTDPFSGFRCFSQRALDVVALRGSRYEAELESLFAVTRAGLSVREVPIPLIYGPGTSKMGHRHGAVRGRVSVVAGYARTIHRARRQASGGARAVAHD